MKEVSASDFEKLNIRVGTINGVKQHPERDEFILLIDLGVAERDMQVVADLKGSYEVADLMGKQVVFVENFKPEMVGSVESQGLLLVTLKDGKLVLLQPDKEVLPGVQVSGVNDGMHHYHFKEGEHKHSKL